MHLAVSPRALAAMTMDGTANDGSGCIKRLHAECTRRAHLRWQTTGEECAEVNWLAAERSLMRSIMSKSTKGADALAPAVAAPTPVSPPASPQPPPRDERMEKALADAEKELKILREQVAALKAKPDMKDKATQFPEGGAAAPKMLEDVTEKLEPKKKAALDKVLKKKTVEISFKEQALRLTKPIEFEPRHHGAPPTAVFRDQADTLETLRDVVGVLAVYEQAMVEVEGHTATPDAKLDAWSHQLARNRAEHVKEALVNLGMDGNRLTAVGKPGKYGTGRTEVRMTLVEF